MRASAGIRKLAIAIVQIVFWIKLVVQQIGHLSSDNNLAAIGEPRPEQGSGPTEAL